MSHEGIVESIAIRRALHPLREIPKAIEKEEGRVASTVFVSKIRTDC